MHDAEGNNLQPGDLVIVAGGNMLYRARVTRALPDRENLIGIIALGDNLDQEIAVNNYSTLRYSTDYRGMADEYIIALLYLKN